MVGIYRLNPVGFRLAAGTHVLRAEDVAGIAAADQLMAVAEAEAARIVADAAAAHAAERARGYAEGLQAAQVDAVARLLEETADLDRSLAAVEGDLSRLVVAAVKKIIADFDDVTRAEAVVKAALTLMRREKRAELLVPPALAQGVRERIADITAGFPDVELIEVVEDATLTDGRIVLQSGIGRVDGHLASRLEDLETVIRSAHARLAADHLDALGKGSRHDPH